MNWTKEQLAALAPVEQRGGAAIPMPKRSRARGVAPKDQRTYNGRVFHSKAEMKFAMELDIKLRCAAIAQWTAQVNYPIVWPGGAKICSLIVDFEVIENDGSLTAYEVKGHETDTYKLKYKLLKAAYPKLHYVVVKP